MSTIKIPSRCIYGNIAFENTKSNTIKTVEANCNQILHQRGNVIAQNYTVTFWEKNDDGEYIYVGDNPDINPITFSRVTATDGSGEVRARIQNTPWKLKIEKQTRVFVDPDKDTVDSHDLKRTQVFDMGYGTRELTNIHSNSLKYDPEDFSFIWYFGGRNDYNMIIKTSANVYIMKEKIEVIGSYYDIQYTLLKQGDAEIKQEVFQLPTNELCQEDGYYWGDIPPRILKQYENGKEVYTIKCSVGTYYYTDGFLAISPENSSYPAVFVKYDIVEPYVFTSKGEVPLSTKSDGTAKQFEVIGVDFSYKGVVWQELTLQEYVE